jgi:hypothetical protein
MLVCDVGAVCGAEPAPLNRSMSRPKLSMFGNDRLPHMLARPSLPYEKIGLLSFGRLTPSPQSQTRLAADALLQSIDLLVAAEALGANGAYLRVHHFARQLASPSPLMAAVGAKTGRIEIGTAVIDMRYDPTTIGHPA